MPVTLSFVAADHSVAVSLESKALATMLRESRRAGRRETGGILVGQYGPWLDRAIVSEATAAPPDSVGAAASFARGVRGLKRLLRLRWRRHRYYLGEWHFHPYADPTPSPRDLRQIHALAHDRDYACRRPILIVLGGDPAADWTVSVSVVTGEQALRLAACSSGAAHVRGLAAVRG
jgi:proteasome lid subunit RPN8/RPN11